MSANGLDPSILPLLMALVVDSNPPFCAVRWREPSVRLGNALWPPVKGERLHIPLFCSRNVAEHIGFHIATG
jgi:hypothetical protein